MEKEVEEVFNSTYPDWLDLPESIATNIILEHLEIVDYIRFSAVCKKWYSIQKEHRTRYSPYPPSLPSFPWLSCNHCATFKNQKGGSILFYLPNKHKSYNIPVLRNSETVHKVAYGYECLLLCDVDVLNLPVVQILNPITGVRIRLPPCSLSKTAFYTARISHLLSDPNCTIFTVNRHREVYLYGLNGKCGWRKVADCPKTYMKSSAFCNNKIYRLSYAKKIQMIDTLLSDPIEQMVEMDCSEISANVWLQLYADLVDFFGELVLVVAMHTDDPFDDEEFNLYKADFSINKWVRMETLGDGVLFYSSRNTLALRAVDVGCKKNAIYLPGGFMGCGVSWRAFDLSTRDWIDGPPLSLSNSEHHWIDGHGPPVVCWSWFFPALYYLSGANTNGSCPNSCFDT